MAREVHSMTQHGIKPSPKEMMRYKAEDMVRERMMASPMAKKEVNRILNEMMSMMRSIGKPPKKGKK